jgi:hypothetical protein
MAEYSRHWIGGLTQAEDTEIRRELMPTWKSPWVSEQRMLAREEGWIEGWIEGRAEGWIEAIFTVLGRRGIEIDDESRDWIESCRDQAALEAWLECSLTAATVSDLFAEHAG